MTTPVLDLGSRHEAQPARPVRQVPGEEARRLTFAVAVLASAAAVVGLAAPGLYQDDVGVREMYRGYDLVTLVVAVPTMLVALRSACRGSARGRLIWLGALGFTIYDYALYVFGAAFNDLFLVHVAILVAATGALATELLRYDVTTASDVPRAAARRAAGLLGFLGVGLGGMWVFYAVRFAVTGETPVESTLVVPIATTHLGYALDLVILVPAYLGTAVLLWRGRAWGVVLGVVLLIAGLGQQLAYMTALVYQARADIPGAAAFDPGEPLVVAAYAIGAALLLRSTHPSSRRQR